jgi:hypothetical protein
VYISHWRTDLSNIVFGWVPEVGHLEANMTLVGTDSSLHGCTSALFSGPPARRLTARFAVDSIS